MIKTDLLISTLSLPAYSVLYQHLDHPLPDVKQPQDLHMSSLFTGNSVKI